MKDNLKEYKLSTMEKVSLWLNNYELGESITESFRFIRYYAMDRFASNIVASHYKDISEDHDFLFTLSMDPITEIQVKKDLLKQKKIILKHLTTRGYHLGSHLYQFYLQYICDDLTETEKKIFLENYIAMIRDKKGKEIANQKRRTLEKRIGI